jgi:ABC-type dipeptide/oligopeptide/nickel transport system permease subunit
MIVNMVLGISGVIISEAALGFLGLGASPYSWGAMLSAAKTVLLEAPHIAMILSLTMAGLIIGLNLLGDGLRDYLDPNQN